MPKKTLPFAVGTIVRIKESAKEGFVSDDFDGNAIFRGWSTLVPGCYALERLDGQSGGAQNNWWNFNVDGEDYLEALVTIDNRFYSEINNDK